MVSSLAIIVHNFGGGPNFIGHELIVVVFCGYFSQVYLKLFNVAMLDEFRVAYHGGSKA